MGPWTVTTYLWLYDCNCNPTRNLLALGDLGGLTVGYTYGYT